jgi:hypothetical protein
MFGWTVITKEDSKDVDQLFLNGKTSGQMLAKTEGYMS